MADAFVAEWQKRNPGGRIILRDVAENHIPHITEQTIAGYFTPIEQHDKILKKAVALSDELIEELFAADTILISAPIYNFSVPSALKAWIDHVVRIDRTFTVANGGYVGLLKNKKVHVMATYGAPGYSDPAIMGGMDFLKPFIASLFSFLGSPDVKVIMAEGTNADAESAKAVKNRTVREAALAGTA
jgi:FMN-dependent NADH-azoreductase